jgi:hypothetical protein
MEGSTYYSFEVSWSNFAGNCQLIVKTDYPDADEAEVKRMFIYAFFSTMGGVAERERILREFCKSKLANPNAVVMFEREHDYTFYQQDAVTVNQLNFPSYMKHHGQTKEGLLFTSVEKHLHDELIGQLTAKGIDYCKF